ncbi:MAG: cupin domain-containing protein [Jatrophihabitans sp.]|uniref:cupin domain-containing protein n=1 Tax=Jatrophihabitans sp. TaxID=1932789 RepID=UPI0039135B9C
MSYPEAKYFGDTGTTSARLHRADEPPALVNSAGGSTHYLATGADTSGEFGLYRWNFGPNLSGPDLHFHRTISESFYILSGVVSLFDGNGWIEGRPGDFLHVPQGGVHGFRNESGEEASMLLLFTPGAPREEYFEWLVGIGRGERSLSDEERGDFYRRHDTYWV